MDISNISGNNNPEASLLLKNQISHSSTNNTNSNQMPNGSSSSPTNFSIKLNQINNNPTSILSQFQTIQSNQQAATHKRNQSLQGFNLSANQIVNGQSSLMSGASGGGMAMNASQGKKLISLSIDSKKGGVAAAIQTA